MISDAEIADRIPFADIALTGGVLAEESLKLFKQGATGMSAR
ncbi:MAG TPA: hypothetical protein VHK26_14260 [Methyloceanibacter sp.]|nr:hypothetical protein [Methyloceanibacter sp.]